MNEQPVEIAVGVLSRDGKVWVQHRRNTGFLDGYMEFPGGKIEPGETPLEGLLREVEEETGLTLRPSDCHLMLVQPFRYPEQSVRIHFFRCWIGSEDPRGEGAWTTLADLSLESFPPANRWILAQLKAAAKD